MKVTAALDATGYPEKDVLTAAGFVLTVGDYNTPLRATIKLGFDEGLALLGELVAAAKTHHDAVTSRLGETARLAAFGAVIDGVAEVVA